MKIGTRSVLYGAHCFLLHPWFVAAAWWQLYGIPWDPRLWVAFFVHDIGYVGKPNMDGVEGEAQVTSCWECNSGKSSVPLEVAITGADPTEKAIELLERERQLAEYNALLSTVRRRRECDLWELVAFWNMETGRGADETTTQAVYQYLLGALKSWPRETIREAMEVAVGARRTDDLRYVGGILRKWRDESLVRRG